MQILKAGEITVRLQQNNVLNAVSFIIEQGEQWAITGPSGSGKTTLLKALTGRQFFKGHITFCENDPGVKIKMAMVEQQHHFKTLSNTTNFYYQQRFNSQDAEDAITVEEDLQTVITDSAESKQRLEELTKLFDINKLFSEPLIKLSNGENKRLQIVKALLQEPLFLLLDSPFNGLDAKSREDIEVVLDEVGKKGVHIVMVTGTAHMPFFITNVLSLSADGSYKTEKIIPERWNEAHKKMAPSSSFDHELLRQLMENNIGANFEFAVRMNKVSIEYDRKILHDITWEARNGERWSLSGPNGSGKSTLLSLVNADNPQAYANDIYLFDKKRGTGESIWDIKKKTGFVSPELHLYFEKGTGCFNVVASGLFDTTGLFRQINEHQSLLVTKWMQLLKIEHVQQKFLYQLSNSEQRLVLLARALVKNPPLLILDEPCQGLDEEQTMLFKEIINEICLAGDKTLIYVSHYAHEVPECVTKFIRLENGMRVE